MNSLFEKPIEDLRPWGKFIQFTHNELSTVKIITVNAGEALSLQKHHKRDEFWFIISGSGTLQLDDKEQNFGPGDKFFITRGSAHRVTALGEPVTFLEIAVGEFDENDIERLEDRYGRTAP